MKKEKLVIIGSGPAGLTAALYSARARLEPLVVSGTQLGGQISITNEVENYPGFPQGTTGPELVELMRKQAEVFGARLQIDEVTKVDFSSGPPFTVETHSENYEAEAVIVTAGASPKRLGVPGEDEFIGRGVSFCATCDGFFFREKDVVVVGGGDSAMEEGIFLTKFANRVDVLHRRDELRAGEALKRRAFSNEKLGFIWDTVLEEIVGNGKVQAIRTRNVKTGDIETRETDGVFIFIGHYPNSSLFEGQLEMDEAGYLTVDKKMMTSVPGVFAAGEIMDSVYRQIATSVGQGTAASMMTERWLEAQE
ncbi:MAG: thioredoxin-disulfide reductase [Chloroflexi bacterium]|nr:thioredoxin-disulfide reductase [Chloroflexota bacterium]MDK1044686.1 thioredoxin-disulfide reductase [Anaerolineales bacterium]MCH8338249.1 thioredoxin-disulfide reductase [Chloroflexota bacterium]MCH8340572.1 thioredoxin-disulfide reductase [Chloroflexota bacterium]MCH8876147.1 thioredoxin-disulfide reductase [Chloroflexota bacterium]